MSYNKSFNNPSKPKTLHDMAKIDDWIELPNGGKLFLLPIKQQDQAELAARIETQFKQTDDYVEHPFYYSVEPTDNDPGERVLWDDRSLDKSGTDDDKAWMIRYKKSQALLSEKQESASSFMTLVDGTYKYISPQNKEFNILIDDDNPAFNAPKGWLMKQKRLGFDADNIDPYELKYAFVSSLIPDIDTLRLVFSRVTELSMRGALTQEALNSFRRNLQREMVKNAKRLEENLSEPTETITIEGEQDRILELQQSLLGDESSQNVEPDTVAVGDFITGRSGRDDSIYGL